MQKDFHLYAVKAQAGRNNVGQGERAWSGKLKNFLQRKEM